MSLYARHFSLNSDSLRKYINLLRKVENHISDGRFYFVVQKLQVIYFLNFYIFVSLVFYLIIDLKGCELGNKNVQLNTIKGRV